MPATFALLDDCHATPEQPTSRLYTGWRREHRCTDPAALDDWAAAVQADLADGRHAVLLADYEWGVRLQQGRSVGPGALRALVFDELQRLSQAEASAWLAQAEGHATAQRAGVLDWRDSQDEARFGQALHAIHQALREGECYQVNHTLRRHGRAFGSPLALYRRLRAAQPVPYGALLSLPPADAGDAEWVLSCSPELFIAHQDGQLTARPMKGTAPRQADAQQDGEAARALAADPKNRAENLMITDLLRNDLGRLAQVGSVQVPALFALERHATVWQMTSTVTATPRPEVDLAALLRATFPCGSITGAPKLSALRLIERLEGSPRSLYTGALGWLEAPQAGRALGGLVLSVPIRTLLLGPVEDDGGRAAMLGVGAGIVLDSEPAAEWAECRLKGRFATTLDPGLSLIETLFARRDEGVRHLQRHLARLAGSARTLGFALDHDAAEHQLRQTAAALPDGDHRLRLTLAHDGTLSLSTHPLAPLPPGPVVLCLADVPAPLPPLLARLKTTHRAAYDAAVRQAESQGAFDALFFNAQGRLTEGARSNVFVKLDGRWWTPPLDDGVLPGVMRGVLLDDSAWGAAERSMTREDLARAEALAVCNALRGAVPAFVAMAADTIPTA